MSFLIYTRQADLYRLNQETSDPNREKYVKIYSNLRVNLQPAGLEYAVFQPEGASNKLFRAFTTYSGCQIGMRLVTSGTATYSGMIYEIQGLEPFMGPLGYTFELLLRKSTI